MADIFRGDGKDGILRHVCRLVADALEEPCDENQVEVAFDEGGIFRHEIGELVGIIAIHGIELTVARLERASEVEVIFGIGMDCVAHHFNGMAEERTQSVYLGKGRVEVQLPSTPGDPNRLIGDAFEVHAHLHRRDDVAEVRSDRVEAEHDVDAVAVDLDFQSVDLLVIGDNCVAPVLVALKKALAGIFEIAQREARHHKHILAEPLKSGVEVGKDMAGGFGGHVGMLASCLRFDQPNRPEM